MKTVLCVAFHFPPSESIAAARMRGYAKYLPQFGWRPVFLCPRLEARGVSSFKLWETPYRGDVGERAARSLFRSGATSPAQGRQEGTATRGASSVLAAGGRFLRRIAAIPDPQRSWIRDAAEVGTRKLREERVDAILSSGPPWSAHLIARVFKRQSGVPWIAEYRDLWTKSHHYPYGRARLVLDRRIEMRTTRDADLRVTVSEPLARNLLAIHPQIPVEVIRNGFDPDDVLAADLTDLFTITYTGRVYWGCQDPGMLFRALRDVGDSGALDLSRVRVRFYGPNHAPLRRETQKLGLGGIFEMGGVVPRDQALRLQRESQLLLLLNWTDPTQTGIYTGKLFEYLAARRPILAIGGGRTVVTELLENTSAGRHPRSIEGLHDVLCLAFAEYEASGAVAYHGSSDLVSQYDQRAMCAKLARALDRVV